MNPSYPLRIASVLFVSAMLSPSGLRAAQAPAVYRINCGGDKFADDSGHFWQADAWYKGGKAHSEWNDTYVTENKHLFLTWRHQDTLAMRYAFPAPAGNYKVRLHFAEHDTSVTNAGMRVFRVLANGKTLIDSLDIYKEVFARVALTKEFIVASKNDSVVITFAKMVYDPIVSGIEVYPEAWKDDPYPMVPPYRLACGGMGFTDPKGNVWLPDGAYGEGGRNSQFTGTIANTDLPMLYLSERWDNSFSSFMKYAFPVPDDRNYVVRLHFAETHKPAAKVGARMFDININDTLGYANMDIFAAAGFATATTLELNATRAVDGVIHVAFISTADAAKINGIEVFAGMAAVGIRPSASADRYGEGAFRGLAMGPGRIRAEITIPGPHSLVLLDPAGREIAGRTGTGPSASEFSGLRPGPYLLRLQGGAGTWVRRTMVPR